MAAPAAGPVETFDAIIIGAGPAGLSAALYTAREGLRTLVLDKSIYGGMAAVTERIENYPGFSQGVGGLELITQMVGQAERFGAECRQFVEISSIEAGPQGVVLHAADRTFEAKTALIATGSTYRQMNVPGEAELIGRGLHFCATCDAPLYKDKRVVVVGGGNSALQESLFIARFARQVELLVRGPEFTGTASIIDQVLAEPRIKVRYNTDIASLSRA